MLLHQLLAPYNVILASGSPRRQELLRAAEIPFTIPERFHAHEKYPSSTPSHEVPAFLSLLKSQAYPTPLAPKDILITADTVVILNGEVIGKPAGGKALEMLEKLNGQTHTVTTAVTLRSAAKTYTFSNSSSVTFELLSQEELKYYALKYAPYDKAGAYGIQEWIGCIGIKSITGSFYNVMGLPICQLYRELKTFLQ